MNVFGATRSRIRSNYALITPDTHVPSPLIGWRNATAFVHITPEMGARFKQYTAVLGVDAESCPLDANIERMVYVQEGAVEIRYAQASEIESLTAGGYAYFPAGKVHTIKSSTGAKMTVFERVYLPLPGAPEPRAVSGQEQNVEGVPFLGDPDARLKTLLPIEPAFDMAVNIFMYQPGATLPFVEIHVMEHGLLMLSGAGVYRLGDDYYPVAAGDVIWMASYCPQWFVAMGTEPARYLYYKDIHRDRLEDRR